VVKAGIGARTVGTSLAETTCVSGHGVVGRRRRHAGMKPKVLLPILRATGGKMIEDLVAIEKLKRIASSGWRSRLEAGDVEGDSAVACPGWEMSCSLLYWKRPL
jgi:hypothetical protein